MSQWQAELNSTKRRMIVRAIVDNNGNKSAAARQLGIHRVYLLKTMAKLGMARNAPARKALKWSQ